MERLKDRVAIVTGGARGIGRAIVEAFNDEGAAVAIIDLPGVVEATSSLRSAAVHMLALEANVAEEGSVKQAIERVLAEFGQVDILVNNAGITGRVPFVEMSLGQWDEIMNVNLRGVYLVTRHVVPAMLDRGYGRIINVASQLGQRGAPNLVHYCASKAGVIGFTKALARELAPYITVNAIAPGPILTDMVREREASWRAQLEQDLPLKRLGRPEEVAPTAVFLASDDGALYTGQTLGPNCGHVML